MTRFFDRLGLAWSLGLLWIAACAGQPIRSSPHSTEPESPSQGLTQPRSVIFTPEDELGPAVSRDGSRLLYTSAQSGNLDIWIRDFRENAAYPLTRHEADDFDVRLAPDGQRWAFVSRRSDAKGDIFIAEGFSVDAVQTRLTGPESTDRQPVFAKDGRAIYYTSEIALGEAHIAKVDLETRVSRRVSPGPGIDPEVSPGGEYLVYTQTPIPGAHPHPRLMALRLSDGAVRPITRGEAPEGFARFYPAIGDRGPLRIAYVRFLDDDNADGVLDARDQASLWSLRVSLDALFEDPKFKHEAPWPLTDGADDELFPDVQSGQLYFTRGTEQQDIWRLPPSGMFPEISSAEALLDLAETLDAPRSRRFAYLAAAAKAEEGNEVWGEAFSRLGALFLSEDRPDLAEKAYQTLVQRGRSSRQLALARLELLALHWRREAAQQYLPIEAGRVRETAEGELRALALAHADDVEIRARVDYELAELALASQKRASGLRRLEGLAKGDQSTPKIAAKASMRRLEVLAAAYEPDALGAAYARLIARFSKDRELVKEAAQRIVKAHMSELSAKLDPRTEVSLLRRVLPRYEAPAVRAALRWRLQARLHEQGDLDAAALELTALMKEAHGDRWTSARALRARAEVNEARHALPEAREDWRRLLEVYSELPGYAASAREAITRVSLAEAVALEAKGELKRAQAAYRRVVENDPDQVKARRRMTELAAKTGTLAPLLREAKAKRETSPGMPMARYAYALALAFQPEPELSEALSEVEAALKRNPQLLGGYQLRGWIKEMEELAQSEDPGWFKGVVQGMGNAFRSALGGILDVEIGRSGLLEQAVEDYKTALRLNPESTDPETEAELLINLGNAHYRLAEATQDLANMLIAFRRYAEALQLDYRFHDPMAEMVFWESFGRAASWMKQYGLSVTATRRAIRLAEQHGAEARLAQLYGNLALVYDLSGEDADAAALRGQLDQKAKDLDLPTRQVFSLRERARAELQSDAVKLGRQSRRVLEDLSQARAQLKDASRLQPADVPMWVPAVADATQAQYGFRKAAEANVNLAIGEAAYRSSGALLIAQELRDLRRDLTQAVIDEVPRVPATLWVVPKEPLTLVQQRERLGLFLASSQAEMAEGNAAEALRALQAIGEELESWIAQSSFSRQALILDRVRWLAALVELALSPSGQEALRARGELAPKTWAKARLNVAESLMAFAIGVAPPERDASQSEAWEAEMKRLSLTPSASAPEGETEVATEVEAETAPPRWLGDDRLLQKPWPTDPEAAWVKTASIAKAALVLTRAELEARQLQARVAYLKGLVQSMPADAASRLAKDPGSPSKLQSLVAGLDAQLNAGDAVQKAFQEAAQAAAGAGPLGLRSLVLSLDALQRAAWLQNPGGKLAKRYGRLASDLAEAGGDLEAAVMLRLSSALLETPDSALTAVDGELSVLIGPSMALFEAAAWAQAEAALAQKAPEKALWALNRLLLVRAGSAQLDTLSYSSNPQNAAWAARLKRAWLRLQSARKARQEADFETDPGLLKRQDQAITAAVSNFKSLSQKAQKALSPDARSLLFGTGAAPDELFFDLQSGEAMLFFAPLAGELVVFLLDGDSESGEVEVRRSGTAIAEVKAALKRVKAARLRGQKPPPALENLLSEALFGGFDGRILAKKRLYLVPGLLGEAIPFGLSPSAIALSQLSSASALRFVQASRLVEAQGQLWATTSTASAPGWVKLDAQALIGFWQGQRERPNPQLETRDLRDRSPAELLPDAEQAMLKLSLPLELEPAALMQSRLDLAPQNQAQAPASKLAAADRHRHSLRLAELRIPARLTLFTALVPGPDPSALLRLDQAMAAKGNPSLILLPEGVSEAAIRHLSAGLLAHKEASVGAALAAVVAEASKRYPELALAVLVGSPGLSAADAVEYAKDQLSGAQQAVRTALAAKNYPLSVKELYRWIRLMRAAGETKRLAVAYEALVGVLQGKLEPPDEARAADVQKQYLDLLKSQSAREETIGVKEVELAYLYSLAGDSEASEATFKAAFARLQAYPGSLARGYFRYGQSLRKARRYEDAAAAVETSIRIYQKAGVYQSDKRPVAAVQAVLLAGVIYLNQLSDPVRAKMAYERALAYATNDRSRISLSIDLARVARRSGEFEEANRLIQSASQKAKAQGLPDLELSAAIEAANIAWYQGDYRRGASLCEGSLKLVDSLKSALLTSDAKQRPTITEDTLKRRQIFLLSVCGVVAMSQRRRSASTAYLSQARRLAVRLGLRQEVATQHNNLGRMLLAFDEPDPAIAQFRAAELIDQELRDRYALAYDFRNLGLALTEKGRFKEAGEALERALSYAEEVQDANNILESRFALAELARKKHDHPAAKAAYRKALPEAERLSVTALRWQIHLGLGLVLIDENQPKAAEAELQQAVAIARSVQGPVLKSAEGRGRTSAYDALIGLFFDRGRFEEAFQLAEEALAFDSLDKLSDSRLPFQSPSLIAIQRELRQARDAASRDRALSRLKTKAPALYLRILPLPQKAYRGGGLKASQALLLFRPLRDRVLIFGLDASGVFAGASPVARSELRAALDSLQSRMRERSELGDLPKRLSEALLAPVKSRLEGKSQLAVLLPATLESLPLAALPFGDTSLLESMTIRLSLSPRLAWRALQRVGAPAAKLPIAAFASGEGQAGKRPLPFARRELDSIQESYPEAKRYLGAAVTQKRFLQALRAPTGMLHFAGHAEVEPESGSGSGSGSGSEANEGAKLQLSDGGLGVLPLFEARNRAALVVLSACAVDQSQSELPSWVDSLLLTGVEAVISASAEVDDMAAALLMKHFYRAARRLPAAEALREAQLALKRSYPHPSWWAVFRLWVSPAQEDSSAAF